MPRPPVPVPLRRTPGAVGALRTPLGEAGVPRPPVPVPLRGPLRAGVVVLPLTDLLYQRQNFPLHLIPDKFLLQILRPHPSVLRVQEASFWLLRDLCSASSLQELIQRRQGVLETQEGEGGERGAFQSQEEGEAGEPGHFPFFFHFPHLEENLNLQPSNEPQGIRSRVTGSFNRCLFRKSVV